MPRRVRLLFLSVMGSVVLLFTSAASFWIVLFTIFEGLILERSLRSLPRNSMWRQYLPYVLLLNVFTSDLANGPFARHNFATLGVAFAVVRVFMTTKQLLAGNTVLRQRWLSMAAGGFFLPVLSVGPVFSGTTLWSQSDKDETALGATETMYRMLFGGWILSALMSQWMAQLADNPHLDRWTAPFVVLGLFGFLFFSFWGQSLIAQAGAALAGFSIPQNFDKPWLASDIRDFWNRWHMSMSKFVTQYIFIPLNLRGVKPKVATIVAFEFMGLWHEVKWGYVIWGLVHGAMMAFAPKSADIKRRSLRVVNRIATIGLVVMTSYVANYAFKI